MQHQIINPGSLLDRQGNLQEKGWATDLLLHYRKQDVKVPSFKIKEWDYYAVLNESFGIALTVADNGYVGVLTVTMFDFKKPKEWTKAVLIPFPLGKFNMPNSTCQGDINISKKGLSITFKREKGKRTLVVKDDNFFEGKALTGEIFLDVNEENYSIVMATPFHKKKHFYYNQKTNCQRALGGFKFGNQYFDFSKELSYGVLDWGRGVWTYNNTWYWGSASGMVDDALFGFNIGYGFGDTSNATENVLFYNGKVHKLDEIAFHIPEDNYLDPWRISSSDNRFEMTFFPVIDRNSRTKVLILESDQHQVFGYFTGTVVLDDGKIIELDSFFGFAEKVINRW